MSSRGVQKKKKSTEKKKYQHPQATATLETATGLKDLNFEWLLHPTSVSDFDKESFEKSHLLVRRQDPAYYSRFFNGTVELKEILEKGQMMFRYDAEVIKYCPVEESYEDETPEDLSMATSSSCRKWSKKGWPLRFPHLHYHSSNLSALQRQIDSEWRTGGARADVFLVPAGCEALPPHYESQDSFLLQLEGEQVCRMYKPAGIGALQTTESPDFLLEEAGDEVETAMVCAGDMLYIPRGTVHRLQAGEESHSLYVLINPSNRPSWTELVRDVCETALQTHSTVALREGLPLGYLGYMGVMYADREADPERVAFMEHCDKLVSKLVKTQGPAIVEDVVRKFASRPRFSLGDFDVGTAWRTKYDIEKLVVDNGGFVKIQNFLPPHVAENLLGVAKGMEANYWQDTSASVDPSQNHITHKFMSTPDYDYKTPIEDIFRRLIPSKRCTFSFAKYSKTHHIESHDDRAYKELEDETYSRDIAVIYYLTKNWTEADGGLLVDEKEGVSYVPEFNSVVAFQVPRYHRVTEMKTSRPRYSVFGWFLVPGKAYDLYTGDK